METDNSQTILCIDDDPFSLAVLREILEEDFGILQANGGKDGLEKAEQNLPAIILLDINMPDMDGFAVIKNLKENGKTRHIPVVFVSNLDDEFNEENGLKSGAADYIIKPVRPNVMKARIQNLLQHFQGKKAESSDEYASESYLKPGQIEGLTNSLYYVLKERELFLNEDLRVAHVAQAIGIRPHHLQELLNRHLKISFPNLIKQIRIENAIELMKNDQDMKIIDIMYDSGFQSKSVFNRAFFEITGKTPSDYRKEIASS